MNTQSYSQLYAKFHGAFSYDILDDKFIVINLKAQYNMNDIVLKMTSLVNNVEYTGPTINKSLVRALQALFNSQSSATVLYNEETWALFIGDKLLLYPLDTGSVHFVSSPYFVDDVKTFKETIQEKFNALQISDLIYKLGTSIVYLDSEDVPYPGSHYFSALGNPSANSYRICFLTQDPKEHFPKDVLTNTHLVKEKPFLMQSVETRLSPFLRLTDIPQNNILLSEYQSTNVVLHQRCTTKPAYILQDILDSYYTRHPDRQSATVGIIIEAPINVGYYANDYSQHLKKRFYALSVNGTLPSVLLYVLQPYDRFFEHRYDHMNLPFDIDWTPVNYYTKLIPPELQIVLFDNSIIGFVYKDTFFCLDEILLGNRLKTQFQNVDKMFNRLSFDIYEDENIIISNTYNFVGGLDKEEENILYCVKHRLLPFNLWCLQTVSSSSSSSSTSSSSFVGEENVIKNRKKFMNAKLPQLTNLLDNWLKLISDHSTTTKVPSQLKFYDPSIVKIIFVLARHNVCFKLHEKANVIPKFLYEGSSKKDLAFQVTPIICRMANEFRILTKNEQENKQSSNESWSCRLL